MSFVKKIASASVLALAMITLTTFVAAQDSSTNDQQTDKAQKERKLKREGFRGKGMRDGKRGGGFGMRGLHKLDLTDAQKEQIKGIMESARTVNELLRQEMRTLMQKRRNGEELTETDRTRLNELRTQMKQSMEQNHNTILGILTAEQRQKLEQMKQEKQKRREEFRQRRQENKPTTLQKNDGK
jgi:Spy/CpxP family protein refolding chaperone